MFENFKLRIRVQKVERLKRLKRPNCSKKNKIILKGIKLYHKNKIVLKRRKLFQKEKNAKQQEQQENTKM